MEVDRVGVLGNGGVFTELRCQPVFGERVE